ncbi:MAG: FAD-dependent oxidoreductase [bacterium]|nr:FAD-dependent oxidoreductase [bacterium]
MSQANLTTDVIVIGGGPGGSTTATMLARKGWHVTLFERERFPRQHVGESLLPATLPILEELGVLPTVQAAGFLPKSGATMVWGRDKTPWSWYFHETNTKYPHAYQVWRPQFDQLLLENSRQHGVDVCEERQVVDVLFESGRAVGVRYTAPNGSYTARARFVVDASGQGGLLGRKLGLRRWDAFFRNLSVYAYFTGAQRLSAPDDTNIFIESYPHGWFWQIPLHTGWTSVGVVVDAARGQEQLQQDGPQAFLHHQIAQASQTRHMLQHAQLACGPFVVKDWSYMSDEVVGDGYVLVGDAACFVDPLFSSGVHLACMSGVLAAAYVTTALQDSTLGEAAGHVYKALYYKEYNHFHAMAKLFYDSNRTVDSYFWAARRLLGSEDLLSPRHAFIHAVAGQPPRGYERVVLKQGEAPHQFVDSIRRVEVERQTRREHLAISSQTNPTRAVLLKATPHLAPGVTVQRQPVLADGEFIWGYVLTTAGYPEGLPCSGLVAALVTKIDGQHPVSELLAGLLEGVEAQHQQQVASNVLSTIEILYVDGAIAVLDLE